MSHRVVVSHAYWWTVTVCATCRGGVACVDGKWIHYPAPREETNKR